MARTSLLAAVIFMLASVKAYASEIATLRGVDGTKSRRIRRSKEGVSIETIGSLFTKNQSSNDAGLQFATKGFNTSTIMNGYDADTMTALYMASVVIEFRSGVSTLCTGSIVSARHIMTAAHCVQNGYGALRQVRIWAGQKNSRAGRTYFASTVLIHKDFDLSTSRNDFAIIVSNVPFMRGSFETVQFAHGRRSFLRAETLVYGSGYGLVSAIEEKVEGGGEEGGVNFAKQLQTVILRIESLRTCRKYFVREYARTLTKKLAICATDPRFPYGGDSGICSGDSGGPLYTKLSNGQVYVYGILSFATSANCAGVDQIAGYFNVRAAAQLIDAVLNGDTSVMKRVLLYG